MMSTLAEIRARVERYLIDVPTATGDEIDDWINEALVGLQDAHNFRWMEAEQSFTTSPTTRKLGDVPSDWKEARTFPWLHSGLGGSIPIDWAVSQGQMRELYSIDDTDEIGPPRFVRETETELEVYPFPDDNSLWDDGNYRVVVPYWKYLPELSADGDNNIVTNDRIGERYLLYAATAEGYLFNLGEDRATVWFNRAGMELQKMVSRDKRSYLHRRVTLAPHPDVYGARFGRHGRRARRHYLS